MRVQELEEQPGLSHPGLATDRHDSAVAGLGLIERILQARHLVGTPHEAREATGG